MHFNAEFVNKLRVSGLRPTKQRIKICEILFNREKTFHFTINDLSQIISKKFNENLVIGCKSNSIQILEIQRQGKNKQTAKEFLLGKKISNGSLLT